MSEPQRSVRTRRSRTDRHATSLEPQPVRQTERRALQRIAQLLVIERVEHVVDRENDRMLPHEAIRGTRINDGEVVVVDDGETWRVEIVVLAALHVAARHARAEPLEVDIDAGT